MSVPILIEGDRPRMAWRVRLPLRRGLFLAGAVMAGLILLLPMRLAIGWLGLADIGLAAREVRGSVWHGMIAEARIGDAPLGDLTARLHPLPLLLGLARIDLADAGGGLHGAIIVSRHRLAIEDVTAHVPLGRRLLPLPITAIDLAGVSVAFRDGLCEAADGLVKAGVQGTATGFAMPDGSAMPGGFPMPGGLSGAVRCDGGDLLLPLVSQSGMERLMLRVAATGAYHADLTIRPTTPAARDALLRAGFAPVAGGYALTVTGTR